MDVLVTEGLRKRYGSREVLHGINLRVPKGVLFGFLGPNGSGKSTTIRIVLGLLRASEGSARVMDRDAWREGAELRRHVGYLPGDIRWYEHLTGKATLKLLDAARGGRSGEEIRRFAEVFDLDLSRKVRNYSRGMKQKLGLIQAMMHRPEILILDEPTISLDPLIRETLHQELRAIAAEGRTVLFSSHTLSEVEQICDWVGILRDGHLIEQERIESLRSRALRRVEVVFSGERHGGGLPEGLQVLRASGNRLAGSWVGAVGPLLAWLSGQAVQDVTISPPGLEDLFLTYYGSEPEEAQA